MYILMIIISEIISIRARRGHASSMRPGGGLQQQAPAWTAARVVIELCHLYPCPCPSQSVEQICITK